MKIGPTEYAEALVQVVASVPQHDEALEMYDESLPVDTETMLSVFHVMAAEDVKQLMGIFTSEDDIDAITSKMVCAIAHQRLSTFTVGVMAGQAHPETPFEGALARLDGRET